MTPGDFPGSQKSGSEKDSVVNIENYRQRLVLVCDCGCSSMYVHADGNLSCQSCLGDPGGNGAWRLKSPPVPELSDVSDSVWHEKKVLPMMNMGRYLRKILSEGMEGLLVAFLVYRNGTARWYSEESFDTDEKRSWIEEVIGQIPKDLQR